MFHEKFNSQYSVIHEHIHILMPFVSTKLNLISQQQERKLKHDRTEIAFKYEIKKKYVYNSNILKIEFVVRVKTKKKKKQILKEKIHKIFPGILYR